MPGRDVMAILRKAAFGLQFRTEMLQSSGSGPQRLTGAEHMLQERLPGTMGRRATLPGIPRRLRPDQPAAVPRDTSSFLS
jgi:hypothetical protein